MRTLLILCALAAPALAESTGSTSDAGPSVRGEWEALLAGGCDLDAHHVLTTIEAAALRNAPYALKGYVFKTPELGRLYAADGGWYRPDPAVSAPTFTLPEQACIKKLKDHEAALDAQAPLVAVGRDAADDLRRVARLLSGTSAPITTGSHGTAGWWRRERAREATS